MRESVWLDAAVHLPVTTTLLRGSTGTTTFGLMEMLLSRSGVCM
jgi:hypothetical protein